MKTKVFYLATKITVAVVLVAALAFEALAGEAPKLKLVSHSPERVIIAVDNATDKAAMLTIENSVGDVIYYKEGNIDVKSYSKVFNFKNLTNGDYKVVVKNNEGEHSLNFTVKGDEIKENAVELNPFIEVKNDVLKLSVLNQSQKTVNLSLTNEEGEIFSRNLGKDFSINAGFNISGLEKGNYIVYVSNANNTYSYNFQK